MAIHKKVAKSAHDKKKLFVQKLQYLFDIFEIEKLK
jgi:hypothetical protein